MTTKRINVLAFDGCMGMEVFGLCDTLLLANRVAQAIRGAAAEPMFDVRVTGLATFDLAMQLIRQSAAPKEARAVARMALLSQRGSQAVYVDTSMTGKPSRRFSDSVQSWLGERIAGPSPAQYRRGFNTRASAAVLSSWACGHIKKCWRTGAAASSLPKTRSLGSSAAWRTVFAPSNST